jgi:hypothetical protein
VNLTTNRNLTVSEQAKLIGAHMPAIEDQLAEPAAYFHLTLGGLEMKALH